MDGIAGQAAFARVGGFSPLDFFPSLWLDASDASTLYDATTGGSIVAPDGAVARWEDKSGNGRHATQETLANRPLRKTSVQNGKDVVRFDGVDDTLEHTCEGDTCTIFAVYKMISLGSGWRGIIALGPSSDAGSMLLSKLSGSAKWGSYDVANIAASTDASTSCVLHCLTTNGSGNDVRFYHNSAADGSAVRNPHGQPGNIGGFPSQNSNADIAEIIVFPMVLSTEERQSVENYLNSKWAIY